VLLKCADQDVVCENLSYNQQESQNREHDLNRLRPALSGTLHCDAGRARRDRILPTTERLRTDPRTAITIIGMRILSV
jgi:hypothetical protein